MMLAGSGSKLKLAPRTWFAWQVLAASSDGCPPWDASPIFVTAIKPMKTGHNILSIECIAALRPLQPTKVSATFQLQHHAGNVIVGQWRENGRDCLVAITSVTMDWLRQYCAPLLLGRSPDMLVDHHFIVDGNEYLETLFGQDEASVLSAPEISQFLNNPEATPTRIERGSFFHAYDGLDAWLVLRGFAPAVMEQKWCIRPEARDDGDVLAIYRSWTGFPIWKWAYRETDTGIELSSFEIGVNSEYYTPSAERYERRKMRAVVEDVLLGRPELYFASIDDEA